MWIESLAGDEVGEFVTLSHSAPPLNRSFTHLVKNAQPFFRRFSAAIFSLPFFHAVFSLGEASGRIYKNYQPNNYPYKCFT